MKDISVIIVNFNTAKFIGRCLASLFRELDGLESEVIVVDNGSMDSSVEFIEHEYPECRLIKNTDNRGFGRANNQAIALASAPYMLLVNPDTELLPGCVSELIKCMDGYPGVAVVGPHTLNPDGSSQPSAYGFPGLLSELLTGTFLYLLVRTVPGLREQLGFSWSPATNCYVAWMRGSCLLCRTEAIREVDGFDERYFMFSEDTDLQYRLAARGWKRLFCPQAGIIHHHGKSVEQDYKANFVELYKSKLQFVAAYHSRVYVLLMRMLWILNNGLRWLLFAPVAVVARGEKLRMKVRKHAAALRYLLSG